MSVATALTKRTRFPVDPHHLPRANPSPHKASPVFGAAQNP